MKRLLGLFALFAIGSTIAALAGCNPPPVIFSLPEGTYGYQLDIPTLMTDPENAVPILEPVYLGNEPATAFIFFTLDDSAPFCWNIADPANPQWASVANLEGPIPYIDTTAQGGSDLRTLTAVGTEALFHFPFLVEPYLTTTISAISCDQASGMASPVASHTYTFDPNRWNGDYIVAPIPDPPTPAEALFLVLVGLLTPAGQGGNSLRTIDGELAITGLSTPNPLGALWACIEGLAPGCLETITGDLVITDNPNITTANINNMVTNVTVLGTVTHCNNADDGSCP